MRAVAVLVAVLCATVHAAPGDELPVLAEVNGARARIVVRGELSKARGRELVSLVSRIVADVERRFTAKHDPDAAVTLLLFSDPARYRTATWWRPSHPLHAIPPQASVPVLTKDDAIRSSSRRSGEVGFTARAGDSEIAVARTAGHLRLADRVAALARSSRTVGWALEAALAGRALLISAVRLVARIAGRAR